ncbi:unnamed protein product, partial [Rodentolepis nana]|uniref:Reverse transcriptase n=1 Tax=Rodentolepis nana TaxID=102285 RepID=A0A0R3TJ92_RODNA
MCKTIPRGKTKHYRVLLFPEARLNIIECFVIPRGKTKHYRVFWFRQLEKLKRKREAFRNTADQTGRTED